MRRGSLLIALVAAALAVPAFAAAPTGATLVPVSTGTIGQPVAIAVQFDGLTEAAAMVTLFYRGRSASAWSSVPLSATGGSRYQGEIPATVDLAVRYYIQARGANGGWKFSLGNPETPLSVDLLEAPSAGSSGFWRPLALGAGALALAAGAFWVNERRRRREVIDRAFWVRTLGPLYGLPGPKLAQEVRRLCGTPLNHPTRGLTIFPRALITKKLYEVGGWDEAELRRELAIFAPEMKLASVREAAPEAAPAPPPAKAKVPAGIR